MKTSFKIMPLALAAVVLLSANQCQEQAEGQKMSTETQANANSQSVPAGLQIEDIKIGTGAEAMPGKDVDVHYTGTLTNGQKFDSSKDRGEPFTFSLGAGQVIQGWDKGVAGMKEGGVRKLTIPPELAYGNRQIGPIPANSTLIFEVELLKVK
ncbi:MAG: FKBP-type peptidyl-prolyl cis-trans isomerase [Candidatus Sericytochromatia bacterium]|nr:FKBP-type peptidyl-prolyl cis-trans isomerase [Candidatus Sericytochromatia bacterium]